MMSPWCWASGPWRLPQRQFMDGKAVSLSRVQTFFWLCARFITFQTSCPRSDTGTITQSFCSSPPMNVNWSPLTAAIRNCRKRSIFCLTASLLRWRGSRWSDSMRSISQKNRRKKHTLFSYSVCQKEWSFSSSTPSDSTIRKFLKRSSAHSHSFPNYK